MTTILRSPAISTETRKLASRSASAAAPVEAVAAPQQPPQPPQPPAPPNLDALLAQSREAVLAREI
jgi:hypothetical protein